MKGVNDWMQMSGLNEAIGQFVMANNVHWDGHMMREMGSVFLKGQWLEVEYQRINRGRMMRKE